MQGIAMASYQPDQQLSKTARYVAPRYDPRMHTGWTHNMRRFIRDNEPLGFQIIEGEITIREVYDDKKLEEATESLALTRSDSYTMSREVMFSDLFGGALPDEDSDTGSESTDSTSGTVRIHRRTRLDPALGETSTAPSKTAQGAAGNPQQQHPDAAGAREEGTDKDVSGEAGAKSATATTRKTLRRSSRLRGDKPPKEGSSQDPDAGSGTSHSSDESKEDAGENEDETKQHTAAAAAAGVQGTHTDAPEGDLQSTGGSTSESEEDNARHTESAIRERLISRLKKKLKRMKEKRKKRDARTKSTNGFKSLVDRAKAIGMMLKQTIDPCLWFSLSLAVRTEAYNRANRKVWAIISTSLGYRYSHLIGQLREGDGRSAWHRLVHLHAEETNGAQAHYLQELMGCTYHAVAGTDKVGHVRLYAEALQRINKMYKLAAGTFVQPEILMSRLLALPRCFDHVVETIESLNSVRAGSDRQPLDFHEVLGKVVQFENRQKRRGGQMGIRKYFPGKGRRSGFRPRRRDRRERAYNAHDSNNQGPKKGNCYNCGKPGHYARECREPRRDGGGAAKGNGQANQRASANLAQKRHGGKRYNKGRKKPSVGFLAVEQPDQANTMKKVNSGQSASDDKFIIDSGASGHFCVKGTKLTNARATRREISSAGDQTLVGRAVGDYGSLVDTVEVDGLRTGLASVGKLATHYQAKVIFTPNGVYVEPLTEGDRHRKKGKIGERNAVGLYTGDAQAWKKILTTENGFDNPLLDAVGASARTAAERDARTKEPVAMFAMAAWQRSTVRRFRNPRSAKVFHRHQPWRTGRKGAIRSYRGPAGAGGAHLPSKAAGSRKPRHRQHRRVASNDDGKPEVRFIDLCCGMGGFTRAGMLAGWTPVASVDHCKEVGNWFGWNFSHPFERVDITKRAGQNRLVQKYGDIDVVLFSPPCQPYSVAGAQRPGDSRTQVVEGGIRIILGWMPRLVVIECVANFITCEANPTYRTVVVPLLRGAGYEIYNARCNAAQCGVPVRRDRVFIVAHRYPRPDRKLEKCMHEVGKVRHMALSRWFPELKNVCHIPCHSAAAVFNARTHPHPTMRTMSLFRINKQTYRRRPGDAGPICDAVELTRNQKLQLAGMGKGFHWPPPGLVCRGPCCKQYRRFGRKTVDLLGRSFGNIVIPWQAQKVLANCELDLSETLAPHTSKVRAGEARADFQSGLVEPIAPAVGVTFNVLDEFMVFKRKTDVTEVAATGHQKATRRVDRGANMSREPRTAVEKLVRFHERMGHISKTNLIKIIKEGGESALEGVTIEDMEEMPDCDTCAATKLTKQPHSRGLERRGRASGINYVIHTDSMHRIVPSLKNKDIYIQVFVDEKTRYAWVEFFGAKTYEAFGQMLAKAEARMRAQHVHSAEYADRGMTGQGRPVLKYFSDHASEMVGARQRARLARKFIELTIISPSAKLSNGIAERANRTLLDIARRVLIGAELPIVFWAEAFEMAANIYNRTGHTANQGKSPHEVYFGRPPTDLDRIKVFGCKCFAHEEKGRRKMKSKLDATARPYVYLGMPRDDNRSHLVFNPRTEKFYTATSVVFREDTPGGYLVQNCRKVQKRMKNLVWGKRNPRGNENRAGAAPSRRRSSNQEDNEGTEFSEREPEAENSSSDEGEQVDTWNQIYETKENETLGEIAEAYGTPVEEILSHNLGIPGCDVGTGELHPETKLRRGTGIWLPDDAARKDTSRGGLYPPRPGAAPGIEEEAKEDVTGVSGTNGLVATGLGEPGAALAAGAEEGELGALTMEALHGGVEKLRQSATEVAAIIIEGGDMEKRKSEIQRIVREAEEELALAYATVVTDLRHTLARKVPTPKSYKEALAGDFADAWNEAVLRELKNLQDHDVWEWCELPEGRNHTIDATWAWRVKPTSQGFVDKLKARLCARGFREIYGMDYAETHAPVTTLTAWRACLAEAAKPPWKVHVWDVASAYLLSEIPEATPIYLRPFEGLEVPEIPHRRPLVLRLKRCLYGLKSSGRRWNQTIDLKLKDKGFRRSTNDPCLYIRETERGIIRLNLHVDDCCATYNNEEMYMEFFNELKDDYKLSASADNNMFLGMLIDRTKDGGLQVHQKHFVDEILAKYNAEHFKPVINPARKEIKLSKEQMPVTPEEKQDMARVPYRQVVGSLMYLASGTRPDIAQALGDCARYCSNPGRPHWNALKWILRYLVGTRDLCIRYGKKIPDMPFSPLHGNVDASWGDSVDDRRSTTGYNFISYGGPIVWRSQKQKSVSLSSCESEYMAANEAGKEAVWLARLYKEDFGHEDLSVHTYGDLSEGEFRDDAKPLTIFEDNAGAIALSRQPGAQHKRSKHISIRWHWIREKVQSGELKLSKIDTSLNTADIFTKATSNKTFLFLRDKLVHQREMVERKESANIAGSEIFKAPTRCFVCGEEGHLEPDCPVYKRPDEVEEKKEADVVSKHSESLLVARPDTNHKGSNDMAQARAAEVAVLAAATSYRRLRLENLMANIVEVIRDTEHKLEGAMKKWELVFGEEYNTRRNRTSRSPRIERIMGDLQVHRRQLATVEEAIRDGERRKAEVRRGIMENLEENLDAVMPMAAGLQVEQIVPCMRVDVTFEPQAETHIQPSTGRSPQTAMETTVAGDEQVTGS